MIENDLDKVLNYMKRYVELTLVKNILNKHIKELKGSNNDGQSFIQQKI